MGYVTDSLVAIKKKKKPYAEVDEQTNLWAYCCVKW